MWRAWICREMLDLEIAGNGRPESRAVGRSVQDARIGIAGADLVFCAGDCLLAGSIEFVFPSDNFRLGKPPADFRQDLFCRLEGDPDRARPAAEFMGGISALDALDTKSQRAAAWRTMAGSLVSDCRPDARDSFVENDRTSTPRGAEMWRLRCGSKSPRNPRLKMPLQGSRRFPRSKNS